MSVPTFDQFIEPILRHLAAHPSGVPARETHEAAADRLGLTAQQREEMIPTASRRAVPLERRRIRPVWCPGDSAETHCLPPPHQLAALFFAFRVEIFFLTALMGVDVFSPAAAGEEALGLAEVRKTCWSCTLKPRAWRRRA